MTEYVHSFQRKIEQLEEAGMKIPQDLQSVMLLTSLPSEYESFYIAIESRDDLPTVESLKSKLIEQEARHFEQVGKNENDNNALSVKEKSRVNYDPRNTRKNYSKYLTQKFDRRCYNCGKPGHKAIKCRAKKKENSVKNVENAMPAVMMNADSVKSAKWCLDSGATKHMCHNPEKFHIFTDNKTRKVYTATEQCVKSTGSGEIKLNVKLQGSATNKIKLCDTMFVPEFRNNLLSVSQMADKNYTVTFYKNCAKVKRPDNSVAMIAKREGELYVMDEIESSSKAHASSLMKNSTSKLKLWHERLGHLNLNDLKKITTNEMATGFKVNIREENFNCETCHLGKIHQLPFKVSENRAKDVLGVVHSDICGPMRTTSLGGARYFATFIDDKTRYTEVVILKKRSDIINAFKNYMRRMKSETGKNIKVLPTDNAKEYLSREFTDLLESEGIRRQLTVEHTPQQNEVAERANRTLVEMARCLLLQSKLPLSLWAEAINTASFIRNRCPTKALDNKTPYEMWNQRKPYLGFMRIFGTRAIALQKGVKGNKFEAKGKSLIMVGYSSESKAYRLWCPRTKTIIKSRDVRFLENVTLEEGRINENTNEMLEIPIDLKLNKEEKIPKDEKRHENLHTPEQNEIADRDDEGHPEDSEIEDLTSEIQETPRQEQTKRGPGRPKKVLTGKPGRQTENQESYSTKYQKNMKMIPKSHHM